ncbi:MFS transporter, partial [Streptomyces sp. UNOB3_S3]|uniref:MFS transporter n=1 Tax=Streptomyces sp. UNOB3_S3 TaxID=2871682 RepID=UPI001E64B044
LLGMLLIGAASASNLQSRYAATDLAGPDARAGALSLVVWATTVGSVLGPNLSGPGEAVARPLGLPGPAGTFVFSVGAFVAGWAVIQKWLPTAPAETPRTAMATHTAPHPFRTRMREATRHVLASPAALTGLGALVIGHAVMVSVMTMTPVHLAHHGASLSVVGLTISLHILGMYGLSPLVGRAADRLGRIPVILAGQVVFTAATVLAGTAGGRQWPVTAGLFLLGVG